ncbi:MAG: hypothetical protein OXC54_11440, partial [Rhodospirillaceae bacterium]|nr:hypothetical protein [Rhodospirillaceae bacterium]
ARLHLVVEIADRDARQGRVSCLQVSRIPHAIAMQSNTLAETLYRAWINSDYAVLSLRSGSEAIVKDIA